MTGTTSSIPAISLRDLSKHFGDVQRRRRRRPRHRRRRVLLDARPVRLGQDHGAAAHRRLRARHRRHHQARRRGRHDARAVRPRRQHGVPGLRAVPAHVGARQRRVRAAGARHRQGGATPEGRGGARHRAARRLRQPPARAALRRPASARRAGPRDHRPAQGAAARRAARRPRPQAARADAGRAQGAPARARHHLRLRHPRPGGGAHAERPHRGVQRGQDRAARHADGDLRAAGVAVRRRLRRHVEPVRRRRVVPAVRPVRHASRSAPRR